MKHNYTDIVTEIIENGEFSVLDFDYGYRMPSVYDGYGRGRRGHDKICLSFHFKGNRCRVTSDTVFKSFSTNELICIQNELFKMEQSGLLDDLVVLKTML